MAFEIVKDIKDTTSKDITMKNGSFILGEYALTGVRNAWSENTSYWLSKRGYTTSVYCFTPNGYEDLKLDNVYQHIRSTVPLLEDKINTKCA